MANIFNENIYSLVDYDSDVESPIIIENEAQLEETIEEPRVEEVIEAKSTEPSYQKNKGVEKYDKTNTKELDSVPKPKIKSSIQMYTVDEQFLTKIEALHDKLATSVDKVEKIMEGANKMMTNMVQVSQNYLEAGRIKLRRLELKNKETRENLEEGHNQINKEVQSQFNKKKTEKSTDSHANKDEQIHVNESVQMIQETFQNEFLNSKVNIKREYKLSQKSNFNVWMNYLKSHLIISDLLDVIDPALKGPEHLSESNILKRKSLVRDIVINHVDENYYKKIINESESIEILKKLRRYRKCETHVTHTSVRARLYQIRMRKDERVHDFCERFYSIIREYEASDDAQTLTEQEKRSAFYTAVSSLVPELRNADLIKRQILSKEMTLEEIKSFLLQLEAEKKSDAKEEIRVQRAQMHQNQSSEKKCFRCNGVGHWTKNCYLKNSEKWFCYHCQAVKTHKAADCPQAKCDSNHKNNRKRPNNNDLNRNDQR